MTKEQAIEKVKKLFALSTSSNENEAQIALLKAQQLLAKYKLEMKDVKEKEQEALIMRTAVTFRRARYKSYLARVIANNFCCDSFCFKYNRTNRVCFVGMKDDLQLVVPMYQYALKVISYNVNHIKGEYKKQGVSTVNIDSDYGLGFTIGLRQKFEKQKQADKTVALAIVMPKPVEDKLNSMKFSKSNYHFKGISRKEVYSHGIEDGKHFREPKYALTN